MNVLAWNRAHHWLPLAALLSLGCAGADGTDETEERRETANNGGYLTLERPAAGLFLQTGPEEHGCTATLITPRIVLTAAHCIRDARPEGYQPSIGTFIMGTADEVRFERALAGAVLPPLASTTDFAVVKLANPIDVRSVMPLPIGRDLPAVYEWVNTYGLGCDNKNPSNSYVKQRVSWQWYFPWAFGCPGDSGGPTIRSNGDIVAVTSGYVPPDPANLRFGHVVEEFVWIQGKVRAIETAPEAQYFEDVPPNHYFYKDIQLLYGSAVTTGCDSGGDAPRMYCPDQKVTKAQMATFVGRATHDPEYLPPPATGTTFVDVPGNAWYAPWVERLYHTGMVTGLDIGGGLKAYQPDLTVSRATMTIYLVRMRHGAGYVPPAVSSSLFIDVPPNAWYARWVEQARKDGLVFGAKNADGTWYLESEPGGHPGGDGSVLESAARSTLQAAQLLNAHGARPRAR